VRKPTPVPGTVGRKASRLLGGLCLGGARRWGFALAGEGQTLPDQPKLKLAVAKPVLAGRYNRRIQVGFSAIPA